MTHILSDEEFLQLLNLYRNHGNRDALAKIVEASQGLVGCIADKHATALYNGQYADGLCSRLDWQELKQAGNLGLMEALKIFDPARNVKFTTYAYAWIDKEIRLLIINCLHIRRANGQFRPVSSLDLPGRHHGSARSNSRGRGFHETLYDTREIGWAFLNLLDERSRKIVEYSFGLTDGRAYTQEEISEKMEISRPSVNRLLTAALERLRIAYGLYLETGKIIHPSEDCDDFKRNQNKIPTE